MAITYTTSDRIGASRLFALVYGRPGAGKTTLARTTGDLPSTLLINVENGVMAVNQSVIPTATIETWADFVELFKAIRKGDGLAIPEVGKVKPRWVIIDTLSEVAALLLSYLKEKWPDKRDSMNLWGEFYELMGATIRAWRDKLPGVNVVFLAHAAVDKDGITGGRYVGLKLPGKLSDELPAHFDVVMPLRILDAEDGTRTRKLITQELDGWVAKARSETLDLYEEPDLAQLAARLLTAPMAA